MGERRTVVEGYVGSMSVEAGDEVALHLGVTVPHPSGRIRAGDAPLRCNVEIARAGAARDVVLRFDGLDVEPQPVPADAAARGAGWSPSLTFTVDPAWRSGWYDISLTAVHPDGHEEVRHAGFAVRGTTAATLLVLSTNTWNAYNDWGGPNLYTGGVEVDFARPLAHGFLDRPDPLTHRNANATRQPDPDGAAWTRHWREAEISPWSACAGWPSWEALFVAWAEERGHVFDVATNADLELRPAILDGRSLLLSVGHDEYWSWGMRDTVEAFIARGGNVAFLSGNTSFWQVRLEGDVMVGYKGEARRRDPVKGTDRQERLTSMWSDPIIGRPETHMTGVSFTRGGYARIGGGTPRGQRGYTVWRPEHWLFEGTGLHYGDLLGDDPCVVGYECDGCELTMEGGLPVPTHADGSPAGFTVLGSAPARIWSVDPELGVNEYPGGLAPMRDAGELEGVAHVLFGSASREHVAKVAHGNAVLGTWTSDAGGVVVTSGCTDWTYGLAAADPLVEQVTENLLRRLG
jgi:hypothetical protein